MSEWMNEWKKEIIFTLSLSHIWVGFVYKVYENPKSNKIKLLNMFVQIRFIFADFNYITINSYLRFFLFVYFAYNLQSYN